MQHEITKPSNLLDKNGHLIQKGWARRSLLRYNRENIRVGWHRIKEWDHYAVLHPDYAFLLTISDIGYLTLIGVQWLNYKEGTQTVFGTIRPLTRGNLKLPLSSEKGNILFKGMEIWVSVKRLEESRVLGINFPSFMGRKGIKGLITLHQNPRMDNTVVATPFKHSKRAFYYNHKVNFMPAGGALQIGQKKYSFDEETCLGNLDWGRGVWPYRTHWYWGTAAGKVDGIPCGFNIGYGFGDLSTHTENIIFYDGKAHKFDKIKFHLDPSNPMWPWRFMSNDGRFNLTLKPLIPQRTKLNLLFFLTNTCVAHGLYSGEMILDNGEKIQIDNMLGWAEEIHWRW